MDTFYSWRISGLERWPTALPHRILTVGPSGSLGTLPLEIAFLLPNRRATPSSLPALSDPAATALGAFLADPLLNSARLEGKMRQADLSWICNLPSVTQYDSAFRSHLDDIGLGYAKELEVLAKLQNAGFQTIACVNTPEDALLAQDHGHDAVFIVPSTDAYSEGLLSMSLRTVQVSAVRASMPNFRGPTLGIISEEEHKHPKHWPTGIDLGVRLPQKLI